jgi:hypothetical protein
MKRLIGISGLIILLLQFGASGFIFAQSSPLGMQSSSQIPEHIIYEFYFRRMADYANLAKKREGQVQKTRNRFEKNKNAQSAARYRNAIKKELGINDAQQASFQSIAAGALAKATTLDAQANAAISRVRAQYNAYPAGNKGKAQPSEASLELANLQSSRNAIFMEAKALMSQHVGANTYTAIDSRIKAIILPKVAVKSIRKR